MLIDISIKNYLSFKNETIFSLRAVSNKKDTKVNILSLKNDIDVLKTSVIYWYNASWKTNLLRSIQTIKVLITDSWRLGPSDPLFALWWLSLQPFRLNESTRKEPVEFKITFEINWIIYRYELSLDWMKICSENLYSKKTQKEKTLFKRILQNITIYDFDDNNSIKRVNENNLALSIFAKEGSEEAKMIHRFFQEIYVFFWDWSPSDSELMMINEYETFKPFLKSLLNKADLWIEDIDFSLKEIPFNQLPKSETLKAQLQSQWIPIPENVKSHIWNMYHPVYDDNGNIVWQHAFSVNDESKWTNKILNLAWSIYNVIRQWKILFIDEIDASLHSSLLLSLIRSFNKTNTNSHFQIIFTTQNTHIMDIKKTLRRDQIRFVEKDKFWSSKLSRLSDDSIRKEYITEKNYYKWIFWWLKNNEERDDLLND